MENEEQMNIERYILSIIGKERPETVEKLTQKVQKEFGISRDEAFRRILSLEGRGLIKLKEKPVRTPQTLTGYLSSARSLWYWVTLSLAIATLIAVFIIPEGVYPYVYLRYILGLIFVLWLPGYSFIKALFPAKPPVKTGKKELDTIERVALSIGMSLALVPLTGLLLNYTPWGITLTPVTLALTVLTIIFSTIAIVREAKSENSYGSEVSK